MFKRMRFGFVPTTEAWRIVGLCILLLLITTSSLVGCTGSTCTVTPSLTQPPAPAAFQTAALAINPAELNPGQELSITAMVTNTGDIKGSYMAELKINDTTEQAMELTVVAGETQALSFLVSKDTPGIYEVTLGGLTGQFEVVEPVTLPQSRSPTIADSTTPRRSEPTRPSCCG